LLNAGGELLAQRLGQGREAARQFLREHPETASEIEQKILQHYGIGIKTKEE